VPAQKVQDRWRRSLENLPWFARNATAFWIFDNSISAQDGPPLLVAHGVGGRLTSPAIATFPELATALQAIR
jgi:predicted ABC-type ATPase